MSYKHRKKALKYLKGEGLEIGALHEPFPVPSTCRMIYADAISKEEASSLFPEINPSALVDVQIIVDLDKNGLDNVEAGKYDFVILNHVIEHVANPINVVAALFKVVKDDGIVMIAAPDKRFTFDVKRPLTSFEHLQNEFEQKIDFVSDEHYMDFIQHVHPDVLQQDEKKIKSALESVRKRREHAHVWDSNSFRHFLHSAIELLNITAHLKYENLGDTNKIEYFSIWKKGEKKKGWLF